MKIRTEDAIKHFNGVAALAARLDISRAAVYMWGEFVPDGRTYQLHVLSGQALPPADSVTNAEPARSAEAAS